MKTYLAITLALTLLFTACQSQAGADTTVAVQISGKHADSKTLIEKAAGNTRYARVLWDEQSQQASIRFNSRKTTLETILKNIALAGFDNEKFLAPDAAYDRLPAHCQYSRTRKQPLIPLVKGNDSSRSTVHHTDKKKDTVLPDQPDRKALRAVYDRYFELKEALISSDGNLAADKAGRLAQSVNEVNMGALTTTVHNLWMKLLPELKADAGSIGKVKEISIQRNHFIRLSRNLYELIKLAPAQATVYYQFCPMADEGKGANWLSKESGIRNPYYGAQMLGCGKTVETIK